jgi:DNA polymerase-3 subunit delta
MIYKSYLIEQKVSQLENKLLLFYGENLGLKNDFKERIRKDNNNLYIRNLFQEDVLKNGDEFLKEVFNISLFDEKKIYFINQVNDKILEIVKELESKVNGQKIYFFSENLDKKSKLRSLFEKSKKAGIVACYDDNEISIKKIIMDRLKGFKGLNTININTISNNSGLNRVKLNNELNKITSFFEDKVIDEEKLKALLNDKVNDDFNLLKDEALNGNKFQTNKLLSETLLETEKNILYLNLINQRLNKLSEIEINAKNSNIEIALNTLKPPIFWKEKAAFLSQARKWNSKKINSILRKTYDLEIQVKSNSLISKSILMKKLLLDICDCANS